MPSSVLSARLSAVAVAAVLGLTVVACSDDPNESADEGSTSIAVEDSSPPGPVGTYTVDSGDTLIGIAASYGITLDQLIAANGWSDGADHPIFPGDVVELPAGAVAVPTTRPAASSTTTRPATSNGSATTASGQPATESAGAAAEGGYVGTGLPYAGPERGTTDPIVDPLPDGVYWATDAGVDGAHETIAFTLRQRLTGDDCVEEFPTEGTTENLNCVGDGAIGAEMTQASMSVGDGKATVIALDAGIPAAYEVSTQELVRLISGEAPAADAPDGYSYVPYPFIVTVRGGEVIAADQQFQS